jgi:SnoaL-like domain
MATDPDDVRHANIDLLNRYALAVHKRDWTALGALFTPDAVFTARQTHGFGGAEEGAFLVKTPEKIVEATAAPIESLSETHTIITNHVVDAAPDDRSADMSCYFRAYHAGKGARAHLFEESLGRFEVKTVRVGSAWKICRLEETVMIMLGTIEAFGPVS